MLALSIGLGDGGGIEQLLDAQPCGVALQLGSYLLVAAPDGLVVDGQSGTPQCGQYAFGQFLEAMAEVAYLLFALLRVAVHRQHANDDVLVGYVGSLHQLLESLPVLSGEAGLHATVDAGIGQLLAHIALCVVLSLVGQPLVQVEAAVGRGVGRHLNVFQVQAVAVVADALQQTDELLDGVVFQFRLTQLGLLDEELDVGLLLQGDDATVGVGSHGRLGRRQRLVVQFAGGNDAVGHLHGRHVDGFLAQQGLERQPQLAALHGRLVAEAGLHGVLASQLVVHRLVVAHHLLALERGRLTFHGHLLPVLHVAQFGRHGDDGLPLHILLGKQAVDGGFHLTGFCL